MSEAVLELKRFKDWCLLNDILVSDAVRIDRLWDIKAQRFHLCIVANRTISSKEILIEIPKKVCLGAETCSISEEIKKAKLGGGLALNFAVAYEISLNKLSLWSEYLNIIPFNGERSLPMFWSTELRAFLSGTSLDLKFGIDDSALLEDYNEGFALLKKFLSVKQQKIDFNSYKAAASIAASRAFYVDNLYGECLVPLADFFNHATEREGVRVYDHEVNRNLNVIQNIDALVVKAVEKLHKDREIFNTFGSQSNCSLLYKYGFCETNNKYGSVLINTNLVQQVLSRYSMNIIFHQSCHYFEVDRGGNVKRELIKYILEQIKRQNFRRQHNFDSKQLLLRILIDILETRKLFYGDLKENDMNIELNCSSIGHTGKVAACIIRNEEIFILQEAIEKTRLKLNGTGTYIR
jgi:N-lysine methyltransferase SETD6